MNADKLSEKNKGNAVLPRVIGSTYRHGKVFRCSVCGKFISYSEINKDEVKVKYIPDTEYTVEKTMFTHLHCL